MSNLIKSPTLRRPPPSPPLDQEPFNPIIDNTIFTWLDTCQEDYEKFRKSFCKETPVHPQQWLFFEKDNECYQFIEKCVSYPKKVILVTSGRLGQHLIENLHHCEQLDSVYIYCQNVDKYKEFARPYKKVLGVYSDPVELFSRLRRNLDKKSEETPTLNNNNNSFFSNNDNIERFSQPDLPWNPWEMNTCTKTLPIKGQATIAVIQNGSIPFEIILSNANKLTEINGDNKFSIVLVVNKLEVTLRTYINDQAHLLDRTDESQHILQSNNNNNGEYIYWINFSKETLTVMYGVGEIRPKFKVLEARLDNKYAQSISNITYLHVKVNDVHQNFSTIDNLKDKIHFLVGSSSFLEPPLLVHRQSQTSLLNHNAFYSSISPLNLVEPCRSLYHNLIHFKFDDDDFPDLIQAIEHSIKNPNGWCYQKLFEKANQFGRSKREITYLRLTLDPIVIEIWPPGHYSPIHNHKNAYGMFRVLSGSIVIRLFPALTLNLQHEAPIEYLVRQDQVTWMLPRLNQTHQMKNVESSSCCIIIQCYSYEGDDEKRKNQEIFDFIVNNGRDIQLMKPNSDMNFGAFKEKIRKEWDERHSM
jgi:hypothetical protein